MIFFMQTSILLHSDFYTTFANLHDESGCLLCCSVKEANERTNKANVGVVNKLVLNQRAFARITSNFTSRIPENVSSDNESKEVCYSPLILASFPINKLISYIKPKHFPKQQDFKLTTDQ